jgi:hypothetical protein
VTIPKMIAQPGYALAKSPEKHFDFETVAV